MVGIDRLAQPLHREFDIRRLQMAPAFHFGLISVLWKSFEVFFGQFPRGRSFTGELLPDEGVTGRHWSLFSLRFPQCESLRSVNVRSMFRFSALMKPMRANSAGPLYSTTSNSASIAGLPFGDVVFCLWQFGDVLRGVAECGQWFPARKLDRVEERLIP
jgi:hypothetical protein